MRARRGDGRTLPDSALPSDEDGLAGTHWKTPGLVARAAGRAFVWVDDEISGADRRWVRAHHPGAALLHRVDPRTGLGEADFAALEGWLRGFADTGSARPGLSG